MTDDDKQFVEEVEANYGKVRSPSEDRLCRIIRELEAKSNQRTNLSAVALTVHESTARELAALKVEIESALVVYGNLDDGVLWTMHEQPGLTDTHRARLVRIDGLLKERK